MPLQDWVEQPGHVIPFLSRFRGASDITPATDCLPTFDHNGQAYPAALLLRSLTLNEVRELATTEPCTAQQLWDAGVRRWPALTAEIVAGARRVKRDGPSPRA